MFETNNKIRHEDLEELANEKIFEEFAGKTVLVTGASGLIGSEIVLGFLCADRLKKLNIKVLAMVRNEQKARDVFECVLENKNFELIIQDVNDPVSYRGNVDYIIHCASTTSSKDFIEKPVETIMTTINGTKNLLDYSASVKAESFLFLSTLEVYGIISSDTLIKENQYGCLDILVPRSSYPEGKKLAENLCISYSVEYELNVKIARLCQTFGAGISVDDRRVFAQFAKSAIKRSDIILYTKGDTVRNYCYLTDAVSAILTILKKGATQKAYNIANQSEIISIKQMAELVAKKYNISVKYEIDNIDRGYNPVVKVCLDTTELEKLGWNAKIGIDEMIERTVGSLKCVMERNSR